MVCKKCETEFQGNFCPKCGMEAEANEETKQKDVSEEPVTKGLSEESKDVLKGATSMYLKTRLKYIFLGAFLSAVCAFAMGKILSGVALAIGGILLMPPVLKRCSGNKRVLLWAAAVIFLIIGIATATSSGSGADTIEYVKQYQEPGISYSIGELMEMMDVDVKWEYEKRGEVEYVSASFDDYEGRIEIIFKIDEAPNDYPVLYGVLLDGTSNYELYYEFDSRIFGNGDAGSLLID